MNMREVIGVMIVTAFAGTVPALFVWTIPEANADTVTFILGQLSTLAAGVVGFHFGKSAGDDEKARNSGKAFDAIQAVAKSGTPAGAPLDVHVINPDSDPVPVEPGKAR